MDESDVCGAFSLRHEASAGVSVEGGVKFSHSGHLGEGSLATSLNNLDNTKASVYAKNAALMRCLLKSPTANWEELHQQLKDATMHLKDRDSNVRQLHACGSVRDWLLNNAQLHAQSTRFAEVLRSRFGTQAWRMAPHHDGSAGMIAAASQLCGHR
jgi:hypothetical protein